MAVRIVMTRQQRTGIRSGTTNGRLEVYRGKEHTSERDALSSQKIHILARSVGCVEGYANGKNRKSEESDTCFVHDRVA